MVLCILPPLTLDSSKHKLITTVWNGIYIPKKVVTGTGIPEDIRHHTVSAPKQGPNEPLAMVPHEKSAQQEQPSDPSKVPVGAPKSKKERAVIPSFRDAVNRAQRCPNVAALNHLPMVDLNLPSFPLLALSIEEKSEIAEETTVKVEPDTIEGPTEREVPLENDNALQVNPETIDGPTGRESLEKDNALQIDPKTTKEPTGGQTSTGSEDNGSLHTVPQTNNIYTTDRTSVEVHHEDAVQVEPETVVNSEETAQKSKSPRRVRLHAFMHRFQCLEEHHADRFRVRDLKMIREKRNRNRTYQQAVADCVAEAQGGMIGLEVDERAEGQVRAGPSTMVAMNQPAGVDSAVDAEGRMDGLEFHATVDEQGDSKMTDSPPEDDSVDELMIGSDVDGEMEVDSDEDTGVDDGEPMDVSEEGQNVEASKASTSNPMTDAGHSDPTNIAGPSNLMAIEPQNTAGKVNLKALQDRLLREKDIALRNTSYSGGVVSGSSSASAQLSQQPVASATVAEIGNAAISIPPRVAQSVASTNSASELREARLGKRAESSVVQEEVLSPAISTSSQSVSAPASIASSPATTNTEDRNRSDTTLSSNTPTSTLPSSTSSTAPSSPLPMPTVSDSAPQAPINVSSPSNPTQATTVKRKLLVKHTDAGKAETPTTTSPAPQEDQPAESSKKARSKPPPPKTDAASEDEVAPLSDIPDDRGRKYSFLPSKSFLITFHGLGVQNPIPLSLAQPCRCICFRIRTKNANWRNSQNSSTRRKSFKWPETVGKRQVLRIAVTMMMTSMMANHDDHVPDLN